ncbi:hypothetical protein ND861_00105 [Leptospira sp. 2 VSF19]|uniref:Uncharacterized protein n=1 Tax=Leptospira soteropolitanensis TaxID=2950025 RepID=A0AAW5VBP8_9LEPT|nr:hypothetical protein [Leptospira soteropolitanensis]MCW7491042.1 hypothetical protein [Leptospira soteropolitanensis]MCW7498626.1 hypothetical protein [Leptospira soteropolitanensis]MCW7521781.1 hypothetical protein [Leptospira soteropolitanensis]MCW7524730.1 hypothetical protein [Leptospira soteropolitanensis]MCW7528597.1 hypothetical protein [Leptospira soteropolitanensis]
MENQGFNVETMELAREIFVRGEYPSEVELQNHPRLQEAFWFCEEAFFASLREEMVSAQPFAESLDLAKAEIAMTKAPLPLPEFLKEYTRHNLILPEKRDSLIVRLTQSGVRVIDSLVESLQIRGSFEFAPSMRSASAEVSSGDANAVIFEETTSENQKFYYQIVKENQGEVYLSVKAEGTPAFQQVNLRREGRFILSSKISLEGSASFSGLVPGSYTIEFVGPGRSKSFDLSILVG